MCPGRWLDDTRFADDNRKALMPFGSGPRYCPGHRLAKLECIMAISTLARNFNVVVDAHAGETIEVYAFTLCPSHVSVKLSRR
ncbi:Cytochrome P450 [compost metagenome]